MSLNDRWMRFACLVAGADHELVEDANGIDRMTVGSNAIVLMLVGALALTAWTIFFASFAPWYSAVPAGLLVGAIVFMLDRAMSTSDWSLSGVLQSGPPKPSWWVRLALRVLVAVFLATATAMGVLLALCSDAIDQHLQTERLAANQPVIEEYGLRKQEARGRVAGALEADLASLTSERDRLQRTLSDRESAVTDARQQASKARLEAGREREGGLPGYVRGDGPRFKEAQRLAREAVQAAAESTQDAARMQQRFDQLGPVISEKAKQLREVSVVLANEEQRVDAQMRQDPRWQPERAGPLTRWIALEALRRDTRLGGTVREFDWIAKTTLITLELAFLAIKVLFTPGLVYTVRLTRRTKEHAAEEVHAFHDFMRQLRGGRTTAERPARMKLVGERPRSDASNAEQSEEGAPQ